MCGASIAVSRLHQHRIDRAANIEWRIGIAHGASITGRNLCDGFVEITHRNLRVISAVTIGGGKWVRRILNPLAAIDHEFVLVESVWNIDRGSPSAVMIRHKI